MIGSLGAPGVAVVIVGVLSLVGTISAAVYTGRATRAASRETSQMTGWKNLTESHVTDIARLRQEQAEDRERHRRERAEDRAEIERCNERINDLTVRVDEAERGRREIVKWARDVVQRMRAANFPFPPPPPGVDDHGDTDTKPTP